MLWEPWLFSAKQAWQRPFFRWATFSTAALVIGGVIFFLASIYPVRGRTGTFIIHYNVYLGIDQVVPWAWALFLPGVWVAITAVDLFLAFGWYRHDPFFGICLTVLPLVWSLVWIVALYYLVRVNI